ncbi:hypothetical protein [Paraburkholderia sp. MM5477-R1]|uniref:hypothetical protein n=1 Tax=Paraburkholderia sp. MM5477-R1 TaxID=2991062 RepID=UPI003D20FB0C
MLAQMLNVPIALVSLIDEHQQWFRSRVGLDVRETPRDIAFCAHALLEEDLLVVEDARKDPRFFDNPLVTGPIHAGVQLSSSIGLAIGTLCAKDTAPRVVLRRARRNARSGLHGRTRTDALHQADLECSPVT